MITWVDNNNGQKSIDDVKWTLSFGHIVKSEMNVEKSNNYVTANTNIRYERNKYM